MKQLIFSFIHQCVFADKLAIKTKEDRAKMERLRADMAYGQLARSTESFPDRCYRKHQYETSRRITNDASYQPREHIREWLETPTQRSSKSRCTMMQKVPNPDASSVEYASPKHLDDNEQGASVDKCVEAVLNATIDCVAQRAVDAYVERQCTSLRLPMTDFCLKRKNFSRFIENCSSSSPL